MDTAAVVEAIYRNHIGLFLDVGMRTFGFDLETAKDRLQETFIKVWKHRDTIRNPTPPGVRSFALRTYRNACIDHLRRQKHVPRERTGGTEHADEQKAEVERVSDRLRDPLHEVLLIEELRLQAAAIERLPEKYRDVVRLSLQGVKRKKIAARLGIKHSRIHNLKFRGLKKYEAIIQKMDPHRKTAWR